MLKIVISNEIPPSKQNLGLKATATVEMVALVLLLVSATIQVVFSTTSAGIIPAKYDGRIVGGKNATAGQFPHQISLRYKEIGTQTRHYCGGSIISSR